MTTTGGKQQLWRAAAPQPQRPATSPWVTSQPPRVDRVALQGGGSVPPSRRRLSVGMVVAIVLAITLVVGVVVWLLIKQPWRTIQDKGHSTDVSPAATKTAAADMMEELWTSDPIVNLYLAYAVQNTQLQGHKAILAWAERAAAEHRARDALQQQERPQQPQAQLPQPEFPDEIPSQPPRRPPTNVTPRAYAPKQSSLPVQQPPPPTPAELFPPKVQRQLVTLGAEGKIVPSRPQDLRGAVPLS